MLKLEVIINGETSFTYLVTRESELQAIRDFLKDLNKYNPSCTITVTVRN